MKLFEITENHKQLELLAESDDGTLGEALADTFEALTGEFEDKALSLITVVRNMDTDAVALDTEIKRLTARKKALTNTQDSMREYLRVNMEATGISKIQCPLFTITLGKGRDMVEINDVDKLPVDYIDIKTVTQPNKADILKSLKAGEDIPGASLVKSKSSLRIK